MLSLTNWRTSRRAARAHRATDRELLLASGSTSEQKIGQVDTRHQQNEEHRSEDRQQRRTNVAHQFVAEALGPNAQPYVLRKLLGNARRNDVQVGAGLLRCDSRLQPARRPRRSDCCGCSSSSWGAKASGVQITTGRLKKRKSLGMTPVMV